MVAHQYSQEQNKRTLWWHLLRFVTSLVLSLAEIYERNRAAMKMRLSESRIIENRSRGGKVFCGQEKSEAKQDTSCVKTGQRTAKKSSRGSNECHFYVTYNKGDYISTFQMHLSQGSPVNQVQNHRKHQNIRNPQQI